MSDFEITAEQLRDLSDFLSDNTDVDYREDDDLGVFRTYSGRGMYGKQCVGIVVSGGGATFELAFGLSAWVQQADVDFELGEAFKRPLTDSMGYDIIVYWPSIEVVDDEDGEADEEPYAGTPAFERAQPRLS